jgi:phytochromobilin:ferredoxin oxidoreductase
MNDDVFSNLMSVGLALLQRYISEFMFNGVNTLGTKGFLDYFPEYNMSDGSISKQRSVLGRSYAQRPWDSSGHFNPVL